MGYWKQKHPYGKITQMVTFPLIYPCVTHFAYCVKSAWNKFVTLVELSGSTPRRVEVERIGLEVHTCSWDN